MPGGAHSVPLGKRPDCGKRDAGPGRDGRGTPILTLRAPIVGGQFGRVSRSHAAGALANAIREEMAAWDRGERDPTAIAAHWRELVSPVAVAGRMLNLLGLHASHTQVV